MVSGSCKSIINQHKALPVMAPDVFATSLGHAYHTPYCNAAFQLSKSLSDCKLLDLDKAKASPCVVMHQRSRKVRLPVKVTGPYVALYKLIKSYKAFRSLQGDAMALERLQ